MSDKIESEKLLTPEQAYDAMFAFLEDFYNRTQSDDIGSLLGSMSLLSSRRPLDPAIWNEWMACIDRAHLNKVHSCFKLIKD